MIHVLFASARHRSHPVHHMQDFENHRNVRWETRPSFQYVTNKTWLGLPRISVGCSLVDDLV